MPSRRQQKVSRIVKEAVSDAIANHLSDPRIEGLISVTEVEMSPDLRNAEIHLSILGKDAPAQKRTFIAIEHAKKRIQSIVAKAMDSKFSPVLHFHTDEKFKKTLDIFNLIDQAASELKEKQQLDQNEN